MVIGLAGGSGSGKSWLAEALLAHFKPDLVSRLSLDHYYRPQPRKSAKQRAQTNYDHPDALDLPLFRNHLSTLRKGRSVKAAPLYDFTTHTRSLSTQTIKSAPVIIAEGLLLFVDDAIRELIDVRVFLDASADLRLLRRLARDLGPQGRGRTLQDATQQYLQTVRPMHTRFVEPQRHCAHLILHNDPDHEKEGRIGSEIVTAGLAWTIRHRLKL